MELLPKSQGVLELLETIHVDDAVIERCRALKQQGFTLALDDFMFHESHRPLLARVDIVKVELLLHSQDALRSAMEQLKQWPVKLLAEKVDRAEQTDLNQAQVLLAQTETLSLSDLTAAEIEALSWTNQVAETAA